MSETSTCPHQLVCASIPQHAHFRRVAEYVGLEAVRALSVNARATGLPALADAAVAGDRMRALHVRLHEEGIESLVLATCNRTELYWRARIPGDDDRALGAYQSTLRAAIEPRGLRGLAAVEHLFRVACGLDSVVLGEAEILGQLRTALDDCLHAGSFLAGVVRAALRTGRLARAETRIGAGAQSLASAAMHLLAEHVVLAKSRVVVVGAGATGLKVARQLRARGVGHLVILNRTLDDALANYATSLGAETAPLSTLGSELFTADAVVAAAAAPGLLVTADMLDRVADRRDGRPLVTVDLSMPPVIATTTARGVVRFDIDSVNSHVADQRERRAREIPHVETIIARELRFLRDWARQQALRPIVADLRRKADDIRRAELTRIQAEASAGLDLTTLDRVCRRIVDRLIELPVASLEAGEVPLDPTQALYLRRLFGLGDRDPV